MATKYTKELLQDAVNNSTSVMGVLRYLGLKQAGGTQSHVSRRIRQFALDTSHFKGQRTNLGVPPVNKKTKEEILILGSELDARVPAKLLRRALIDSGIVPICACGIGTVWNGKPLQLEVDHISGRAYDNRINNLRFICPNCHTQQPTNKSWKYSKPV